MGGWLYLGDRKVTPLAVVATGVNNQNKTLTVNGTYTADSGYTGLGTVTVNVPTPTFVTETITITPEANQRTYTPSTDGFSQVTVNAVTASIDSNIDAANIKSGVSILGVLGTVVELAGETKTINANGTYTPSTGKNGFTSVTVNVQPTLVSKNITSNGTYYASSDSAYGYSSVTVNVPTVNNTTLTITPSTTAQAFSPTSPYTGFGSVSVNAVTASIDSNIVAGNIKSGVTILGVTGNYAGGGGGTITSLSITPTTSQQTITASGGVDGYSPITVSAVTSSIDSNIKASNIKSGVSILGVSGNVVQLNGQTKSLVAGSSTAVTTTLTPSTGYNGLTSVTVDLTSYDETLDDIIGTETVPTATLTITENGSYNVVNYAYTTVNVSGGGSSTLITKNITANGTYNASSDNADGYSSVTVAVPEPSGSLSITANGTYGVSNYATAVVNVSGTTNKQKLGVTIDNIIGDVNASGVLSRPSGTITVNLSGIKEIGDYALYYKFAMDNVSQTAYRGYLSNIGDIETIGNYGMYYSFYARYMNGEEVSFPKLTTVGNYGLSNAFYFSQVGNRKTLDLSVLTTVGSYAFQQAFTYHYFTKIDLSNLVTVSNPQAFYWAFNRGHVDYTIDLSKLTTVSGNYAFQQTFSTCTANMTIDLSSLQSVTGTSAFSSTFSSCTKLQTVSFTALSVVTGSSCFASCFSGCNGLESLYFPALTTTSFGSAVNQFNNIFNTNTASTSGTCTVHFPSNLQSTIAGLTGYPTFGGNSSRIVLSFDLPATS